VVDKEKQEVCSENKLSYEAQKELNKRIRKLEKAVAEYESQINSLEKELKEIEEQMASPEGVSDVLLYDRYEQLRQQVKQAEDAWEATSLQLEELMK
jgi:ATP-binding cassette subfamily F protein 3